MALLGADGGDALSNPRFYDHFVLFLTTALVAAGLYANLAGPQPGMYLSPDSLRDIGMAQGLLDGNWFGDPNSLGEFRWYNPGFPVALALISYVSGLSLFKALAIAGPLINGAALVLFHRLVKRCDGENAAFWAFVLLAFALGIGGKDFLFPSFSRTGMPSSAGFTALLAAALWATKKESVAGGLRSGVALGGVFLIHPAPFLALGGAMAHQTCVGSGSLRSKLAWFLIAAGAASVVATPFLAPLIATDRLVQINAVPATWAPSDFRNGISLHLLCFDTITLVSAAWWLSRRSHAWSATRSIVLSCTVLFIVAMIFHGVRIFFGVWLLPIPVHHFQFLFAATLPISLGSLIAVWVRRSNRLRRWAVPAMAALCLALLPAHRAVRPVFLLVYPAPMEKDFDFSLYRQVLANSRPDDLFLTDSKQDAAIAMAAGRKMVNLNIAFLANPYLDYQRRETARKALVDRVLSEGLCATLSNAGIPFALLGSDRSPPDAPPAFIVGNKSTLYRTSDCARPPAP